MGDEEIQRRLAVLRIEHRDLDDSIQALLASAHIDQLQLARLKRRKYMSTALLLIDELGFEPMTRQEASLFFRLGRVLN